MSTEYNSYGRPVDRILDNIRKYDTVEFTYSKLIIRPGEYPKNIIVTVQGIWDGKKVQFDDQPEQTIVRTKEWLKLVKKNHHPIINRLLNIINRFFNTHK